MEPSADVVAQVANEVYAQDLLSLMVVHLEKFEFEVSAGVTLLRDMCAAGTTMLIHTGEEGCVSYIQHLAETEYWNEITYCGIDLKSAGYHL